MAVLDLPPRPSEVDELEAVVRDVAVLAASLDVANVTATRCLDLIPLVAQATNALGHLSVRLSARVAQSRMPVPGGGDAADNLAKAGGTSRAAARKRMADADAVAEHETVAEAAARGEISERQAATIARTANVVPGSEAKLLELAKSGSADAVEAEAEKIRARAMDPETLRREQKKLMRLFDRLQEMGMVHLGVTLPPEIGIPLLNQIDDDADRLIRAARAGGGPVLRREHYRAQALLDLIAGPGWAPRIEVVVVSGPDDEGAEPVEDDVTYVREPVRTRPAPTAAPAATEQGEAADGDDAADDEDDAADDGPPDDEGPSPLDDEQAQPPPTGSPPKPSRGDPHLTVVIDAAALRRGTVEGDELCHIVGGGPTAASLARELLERGAFLVGVVHDGRVTTHVRRYGRRGRVEIDAAFADALRARGVELASLDLAGRATNAELRTALLLGDAPGFEGAVCSVFGCERRYGLVFDHRNPVANLGRTRLDNLDGKCWPCHLAKTLADQRDGLYGGVNPTDERNQPRRW